MSESSVVVPESCGALPPAIDHAPPDDVLRGIVAMLIGVASFALMDAGLKALSAHYPAMQVAALRGLASLPLIVVWVAATIGLRPLLRVRWALHLLRGTLSVLMLAAFAYALRQLPLANAYAIFFVAPLIITVLGGTLLGERVGWQRWLAIGAGLAGVVIVLRPSADGLLSLGGIAVLVSALAYAISAVSVRLLGRTDSTQTMVFWMVTMLSLIATAIALPHWVPIVASDWLPLAGVALAGTTGQIAITEAFRRAPASTIAPLEYTALAWGMGLDWLLWSNAPDLRMLLGAAVIVLSGLYLIRRERRERAG